MEKLKNGFTRFIERPFLSCFILSFFTCFISEVFNRMSVFDAFLFLVTRPHIFLVNLLIIFLSFSLALFFKRRLFVYSLVTLGWLTLNVINLVLLIQRNTQFNASDILVFRYGIMITGRYLNALHVLLITLGIIAAITGLVLLYKKGYRCKNNPEMKASAIVAAGTAILLTVIIILGVVTGFLTTGFADIKQGYSDNGFTFSFFCSVFDMGVDKPEDYSTSQLNKILEDINDPAKDPKIKPNVVFLQLESFVDPATIKGVEFDEEVIPNFRRLAENYPSGTLTVPVTGGGTANTEFEVLTGLSIECFGTIEFPYETFLSGTTCESMAYNYKEMGYKAHAIHNFSAGFYCRDRVYGNLGFDTFTTFESMSDMEYNPNGWVKDAILEKYILKALNSDDNRDFVFAVSVQGHGSYPNDFEEPTEGYYAQASSEDMEEVLSAINYYTTQVREMDEFVGSLTRTLSDYDEPVVLVMYGDHLPGIAFTEDMLETGSLYETEYIVWSNYGLKAEDKDLMTYQLSSHVQSLLGMNVGRITQFHQKFSNDKDFYDKLQLLAYDITSTENIIYGGETPYKPTEIVFGVDEFTLDEVYYEDDRLYVKGENFNEHCAVYINGNRKNTEYVDSSTLYIDAPRQYKDGEIFVARVNYQNPWSYLSKTNEKKMPLS